MSRYGYPITGSPSAGGAVITAAADYLFPWLKNTGGTIHADILAALTAGRLAVGDIIQTAAYWQGSDLGGCRYRVVAGGTGTDDGGSYIDAGSYQLEAVFGESASVDQFGAIGDDSTDNTNSLQAAIDYAQTSGVAGLTFESPTFYRHTATIGVATETSTRLVIGGNEATLRFTGTGPAFTWVQAEATAGLLKIDNLRVRGDGKGQSQTALNLENCGQGNLRRLRVNDFGTAFDLQNTGTGYTEYLEVDDVQISAAIVGFHLSTTNKGSFKGLHLYNCRTSAADTAFLAEDDVNLYAAQIDLSAWFNASSPSGSKMFDLRGSVYGTNLRGATENIASGCPAATVVDIAATATFTEQLDIDIAVTNQNYTLLTRANGHPSNQHGEPRFTFRTGGTGAERIITNRNGAPTRAFVASTTYTLTPSDAGSFVEMNSTSPITVTIPPDADVMFSVGTIVDVVQYNTGAVTVVGGSGVTVLCDGTAATTARYQRLRLLKRFDNQWLVFK